MSGKERLPAARSSPDAIHASVTFSAENVPRNLFRWDNPYSVFGKDFVKEHKDHFRKLNMIREPRLVFTSLEPPIDYRLRRDLLIDGMIKLAIPPATYDKNGYPIKSYYITDLNELPVGIAEFSPPPEGLYLPLVNRFIVYKTGEGSEEDFSGYLNSMIDHANTKLTMMRKQPFPKPR